MCSSRSKLQKGANIVSSVAPINGRPVLQPTSNQVPTLERRRSLKKLPSPLSTVPTKPAALSPPLSPDTKHPPRLALKRPKDTSELGCCPEKVAQRCSLKMERSVKKIKNSVGGRVTPPFADSAAAYSSSPGSIAAARREQVAIMQEQRKMRIAHYGRAKSAKFQGKVSGLDSSPITTSAIPSREEKRCSFITANSDPIYVAYHDEEWGVAVHDDKLLFELLVLTGAQVGSDWTSVLKKRRAFREAFAGFDADVVAKYNEKKITSTSAHCGLHVSLVRAAVDNANRILEVQREFGSLDKYFWGFVNHKPIRTQYKISRKIPVKTSKSENISKDMVWRGFRFVGPTVIHSFMQAAGLTNDHLLSCPRNLRSIALASRNPTVTPAL